MTGAARSSSSELFSLGLWELTASISKGLLAGSGARSGDASLWRRGVTRQREGTAVVPRGYGASRGDRCQGSVGEARGPDLTKIVRESPGLHSKCSGRPLPQVSQKEVALCFKSIM